MYGHTVLFSSPRPFDLPVLPLTKERLCARARAPSPPQAAMFQRVLDRGDLSTQVRMIHHHEQDETHRGSKSLAATPLIDDPVVGALITPRRIASSSCSSAANGSHGGSACSASRRRLGSGSVIADVLGVSRSELVAYRSDLIPRVNAMSAPPSELRMRLSGRSAAMRMVHGYAPAVPSHGARDCGAMADDDDPMSRCGGGEEDAPTAADAAESSFDPFLPTPSEREPAVQPFVQPTSRTSAAGAPPSAATVGATRSSPATELRGPPPAAYARGRETTSDDKLHEPSGTYVMSLQESFSDSVDAFLQISHGLKRRRDEAKSGDDGDAAAASGGGSRSGDVREEGLPSKLLRHAQGSTGLLALLPEALCEHVPLIAAQIIAAISASEPLGVLWVLPEPMVGSAHDFWATFVRSTPQCDGRPLDVRPLEHTPGSSRVAPALRAGEIGFCALHSITEVMAGRTAGGAGSNGQSAVAAAEPPAGLVIVTANAPELSTCEAIGQLIGTPPRCRFVALLCGMPAEGATTLSPLCGALGVRRLLLRADGDSDVRALRATRRSVPFSIPSRLKLTFETLVGDATRELSELLEAHPDLAPLPFDSRALKQRIEQMSAARKTGAMGDADQRQFWSLMACFCARRLVDCAEDADSGSFRSFMQQVACRPLASRLASPRLASPHLTSPLRSTPLLSALPVTHLSPHASPPSCVLRTAGRLAEAVEAHSHLCAARGAQDGARPA